MIEVYIRDEKLVVQTDYAKHSIPLTDDQRQMYEDALQEQIHGMERSREAQRRMR